MEEKTLYGYRRMGNEPHIVEGKPLSPREREALILTALDFPSKLIAGRMGISYQTVKNHKTHIYIKLDTYSAAAAVALLMATDQNFYDEVKQALVNGG